MKKKKKNDEMKMIVFKLQLYSYINSTTEEVRNIKYSLQSEFYKKLYCHNVQHTAYTHEIIML